MRRRAFLRHTLLPLLGTAVGPLVTADVGEGTVTGPVDIPMVENPTVSPPALRLFLCGDVMTGRGIDQILPHPSSPEIYESYLTSAEQYIEVAERVSGSIPRSVDYNYIWGDALSLLEAAAPAVRIVNLETAVTTSDENWPGKGINYRMHPANIPVLSAAGIDGCALANNHLLDWGYDGLAQTLDTLRGAGIETAGAGADILQASAPASIDAGDGRRVILYAMGHGSSGIGEAWAARPGRPGVWLLRDLSGAVVDEIGERVIADKVPGDTVIASIHWGGNWGYAVPAVFRRFAQELLDRAGIDLVHGHSSHHPRGVEVHNGKLILYGCGDFINDYEGIRGHEAWRGDLRVMYLPRIRSNTGRLEEMTMHVLQSDRFRLRRASGSDLDWMARQLDRESRRLGTARVLRDGERLTLQW